MAYSWTSFSASWAESGGWVFGFWDLAGGGIIGAIIVAFVGAIILSLDQRC